LSFGEAFKDPLKAACEDFLQKTTRYWKTWVKHCNIPFEYQQPVIRSALVLKLHIFEDTGAIIAATTTSIPESQNGGRTWDYRYCWLRDAYFVISALNRLGQFEEMEKFLQFLHNIGGTSDEMNLKPVYGIGGETNIEEKILPFLSGFRKIGPVRVGNGAFTHVQHDVYGEMVLSMARLFFDSRLDGFDRNRTFEMVKRLVGRALHYFDKPDSSIWEFRSEYKHYLFSKLMAWLAVDCGIRIAQKMGQQELATRWRSMGEAMRAKIENEAWNSELGFYTQALKGVNPDACNLLMLHLNFHHPRDERFGQMVERYQRLLTRNGFVFRYKNADDFGVPDRAFVVCNFWMVDALAAIGKKDEARALFEKVLSCGNHVGLLSEDIDPETGELWGNFPQTYSHVGIINSAFRLSQSWNAIF